MPACTAENTDFTGVDLRGAFMRSAIFEGANFTRADLRGASVGRANLRGAKLSGADLRCEGLMEADLGGAVADAYTHWPEGYRPIERGVQFE